jgi:hypothetical protein
MGYAAHRVYQASALKTPARPPALPLPACLPAALPARPSFCLPAGLLPCTAAVSAVV